jgi:hypothetical protein
MGLIGGGAEAFVISVIDAANGGTHFEDQMLMACTSGREARATAGTSATAAAAFRTGCTQESFR